MKKRILIFILMLFMCLSVTACGGGFFEEDVLEIESITSKVDSDGTTILKIKYTDPTREPDEFRIPRGLEGNGISEVLTEKENDITKVTINFTDETATPVVFEVKDGRSISGIVPIVDSETGAVYLKVVFSDGTESDPYPLPKGEKGDDGNGIIGYEKIDDLENGGYKIIFHFSQSEDVEVIIPGPEKGEDGRGIEQIMSYEEGNFYYLVIQYTDGSFTDPIEFEKPQKPNTWLTATQNPNVEKEDVKILNAKIGDFVFDTAHKVIYVKAEYGWDKVVSFGDSTEPLTITFVLNDTLDGGPEAAMPSDKLVYPVIQNTYFTDNGYDIPIPTRSGYRFVGWFTKADKEVLPTTGQFTELTPILSSLTLYAIWEEIE